jgi:hypothetical protein
MPLTATSFDRAAEQQHELRAAPALLCAELCQPGRGSRRGTFDVLERLS